MVAVPDPAASGPTIAGTSFAGSSTAVNVFFEGGADDGWDGVL
jgi:hypothetical protein